MQQQVVLLSGSPRKDGNCEYVIGECAKVISDSGLKPQVITLHNKPIRACIACEQCSPKGKCVIDDGANEIFAQIKDSQGLILAAPVYFGTARGDLMNLIQRLGMVSLRDGRYLDGMVGGPIAVGRRGGHTATIQEMLMFCFICGMIVPGSNYWNIVFGKAKGEAAQDEEGLNTARLFAANVAKVIKKMND